MPSCHFYPLVLNLKVVDATQIQILTPSESDCYKLTRKIAEGGMGVVYQAVLCGVQEFEKIVAIKMLHPHFSQDPEFVQGFVGEAKLVAHLVHQNIVQIYHLSKTADIFFIAMEYVRGITLRQFMDCHRALKMDMPIDLVAFIVSRVCRGLEYAHQKQNGRGESLGIVHRDITPKNVMIDVEGEVKIADFGIAKARNVMKDREGEVLMGKAPYMSPEQAQFQETDSRSDLFSVGVVMFELLTGQNPFLGNTNKDILTNVISMAVPKPSHFSPRIPPDLESIVIKALERDLAKRYQTAGEMSYDLEYFMYHKGYGPTIAVLKHYMQKIRPDLYIYNKLAGDATLDVSIESDSRTSAEFTFRQRLAQG